MSGRVQLKAAYREVPYSELPDAAYHLACSYLMNSQSCSQSVVAALHDLVELDSLIVKIATSSYAGQAAQVVGTCGALIAGNMVLDYFFGRPYEYMSSSEYKIDNIRLLRSAVEVAKLLYDRYIGEYGTIICPHIQTQLFGRSYYLLDSDEFRKFEAQGGHSDPSKVGRVVGNASRWTVEILIDEGILET
jgi:hypothetical protein